MIMNQYELIYVTKPQLNATDLEGVNTKVTGLIEKASGQVLAFEDWGRRRLAYPIAKNEHGVYSYLNFVAPAEAPVGIEKAMGMDDSFIRYMTVQLGKSVDVDSCRVDAETKKAERDAIRAADEEAARLAAEAEAEEAAAAAAARAARVAAAEADAAAAAAVAPSEEAAEEVAADAAEEVVEEAAEEMATDAAQNSYPVDLTYALIGSCTNSRMTDLRQAAEMIKGHKVADSVRMLVVPGSQSIKVQAEAEGLDEIFASAGAAWRESGCSMCLGMNGDVVGRNHAPLAKPGGNISCCNTVGGLDAETTPPANCPTACIFCA